MLSRFFGGIFPAIMLVTAVAGCVQHATVRMTSKQEIEANARLANSGGVFGMAQIARIPRAVVPAPEKAKPGTIIIRTAERRLYLVTENGQAIRYGIGVGRDGFHWSGVHNVSS